MSDPRPRRRTRDPERTRRAIIDAVLESLDRGEVSPTSRVIAERAGVSERSVFTHFRDLAEIREVAAVEQGRRVLALLEPVSADGSLRERVDAVLVQAERIYPVQVGVRLAELSPAPASSPVLDAARRQRAGLREVVAGIFADELSAAPDRDQLVELLDAVFDWSMRHQLVTRQQLSQEEASAIVRRIALSVLGGG
ncbi:TetR/AcrR family transcriptional regulator [uncultured Nocardioides sp.]|uniref:TetR/AcrR family transcriptional regulator n=1 Tax=uncultured Nocardioides sp. TaxID=198441 RepID=UPI000C358249|nr:TetR family transcriptional regulator [Nocardioides sp.]